MYLFCAEKYHWTANQTDEQPLAVYVYLPYTWEALARIQAEDSRRQEAQISGNVR